MANYQEQVQKNLKTLLEEKALDIVACERMSELLVAGVVQRWSTEVRERVFAQIRRLGIKLPSAQDTAIAAPGRSRDIILHPVADTSFHATEPCQAQGSVVNGEGPDDSPTSISLAVPVIPTPQPSTEPGEAIPLETSDVTTSPGPDDQQTGNLGDRKRSGEPLTTCGAPLSKRPFMNKSSKHLSDEAVRGMRLQHSASAFQNIENQGLRFISTWKDMTPYTDFQLSDNEISSLTHLTAAMIAPGAIVHALELLVVVSQHKQAVQVPEPAMNSLVLGLLATSETAPAGPDTLAAMVQAARRAQNYLNQFEFQAYETRLRQIMSYVTLYLTLEYAVTRHIRHENPTIGLQKLKGLKWTVFFEMLGGEAALGCKLHKLKDNVGYGKIIWTWATECGMVFLPLLAVLEKGIVVFVKDNPLNSSHSDVVANQLATQDMWLTFARSLSGVVLNLLFKAESPVYTMADLVRYFISSANDVRIIQLFRDQLYGAGYRDILYNDPHGGQPSIQLKEVLRGTVLERMEIRVTDEPTLTYPFLAMQKLNLVGWVFNSRPNQDLEEIPRPYFGTGPLSLPLVELASLLPQGKIPSHVVSYFSRLWDLSAIYGWLALTVNEAADLLDITTSNSFQLALQAVLKCKHNLSAIKHVVLPVESKEAYFLVVCSVKEKRATLLNWRFAGNFASWLKETLMELGNLHIFHEWTIEVETQDLLPDKQPLEKREIALLMLYTLRYCLLRSRTIAIQGDEEDMIDCDAIAVLCL